MKRKFYFILFLIFFCAPVFSQVPVRLEPRHKVALENEYIRLLDVRVAAGDTSLFHIHEIPSYFIPLSATRIGSEVKGQAPQESKFVAGATWYNDFANGPLIHRVWNSDTDVLHVIDLELLSTKNGTLPENIQLPGFKIDFENEKLRVYKFEVAPVEYFTLPSLKTPMLLISVSGSALDMSGAGSKAPPSRTDRIGPGSFKWLGPQKKLVFVNNGTVTTQAILILLK